MLSSVGKDSCIFCYKNLLLNNFCHIYVKMDSVHHLTYAVMNLHLFPDETDVDNNEYSS